MADKSAILPTEGRFATGEPDEDLTKELPGAKGNSLFATSDPCNCAILQYVLPMFTLLAIGSMLGYTLQGVLLAHHARRIDGLSLAFYRNISFVITLLPLAYGATAQDFSVALHHWKFFVLAGLCGGLYLSLNFLAYRSIPVGVVSTFNKAIGTTVILLLGWVWLGQSIALHDMLSISVIVLGGAFLSLQRKDFSHLDNRHIRGMLLSIVCSIPWAIAGVAFVPLSKGGNPLLSGYLWEVAIGIASLVLIGCRAALWRVPIQRISLRTFGVIALCSLPTLVGTGLFSLAVQMGPVGIFSGIGASSLAVSGLLAWVLYGESLTAKQWGGIFVVLAGVVALKVT